MCTIDELYLKLVSGNTMDKTTCLYIIYLYMLAPLLTVQDILCWRSDKSSAQGRKSVFSFRKFSFFLKVLNVFYS